MIALEYWIETPLVNALGWTLFCFVWQAALIASILAAILLLWRPASARARYGLACLAMAAMPAAFGLTLIRSVPPTRDAATAPLANAGPALDSRQISSGWIGSFPPNLYSRLPWVVPFWMTGVACFYLYSVAGWMAARSLRRTGVLPAALEWRERLSALADRLRLKTPILLLESSRVDVPVVIGVLRPAILLPVALLTGLPAGQLELILIHELAHIRRYDYLVNLLQKCVEALLFYHPAVWWVSGLIRIERENCCDDIVVEASGEPREYALTLATLEWNRSAARAALAANGGSLMKRIRRMLKEPETSRAAYAPVFSAGLLLLSIGLA
ncbi:MAG: M56 family metallopeptidase, partial [Bryobacteraceae bacterium]